MARNESRDNNIAGCESYR